MTQKAKKAQATVENVKAQATVENAQPTGEDKAAQFKAEAERLLAQAKEAKEAAKQAAKEAKEAAQKAKAFSSRPIRKSYFVAYYEDNEEAYIGKGDVHYCVEKSAIDEVAKQREYNEAYRTVCIYKVDKANADNERTLISKVYIDEVTKQIVIE